MIELAFICSFCGYDAVSSYRDLCFCRAHLVWFYLALDMDWRG